MSSGKTQAIEVISTLCSDASLASFQCLLLYSARHQHDSFQASPRTAAGIPTIGSSIPDSPPPHKPGRHVVRCSVAALQSIMKPYFIPHLYLYLYIYKYIYKYKIFLWYLLLLGKQLQHCNAARNCVCQLQYSRWDYPPSDYPTTRRRDYLSS